MSSSDSGHDSYYSLTDSDDSLTSSIFGYTCKLCKIRAISQSHLEEQFLNEEITLEDLDHDIWLKCDECGSSYHKTCWENCDKDIPVRFVCCE